MSRRSSAAMGRISRNAAGDLLKLVATRWGWVLIGLGLLIGGLVWGLNSKQITYVQGNQGQYQLMPTNAGILLLQQANTSNYYVLEPGKFTQEDINLTPITDGQYSRFNFIASTDSVYIDAYNTSTGVTISYAHPIEKITFYDKNGQNPVTYTTTDYSGNPNGYTINNWPYAGPLAGVGAFAVCLMFFLMARDRKRLRLTRAAELAALEARPSIFARELRQNTSPAPPQPYQGVNQYPQSMSGSGQYPQSMPDAEISNPYQSR